MTSLSSFGQSLEGSILEPWGVLASTRMDGGRKKKSGGFSSKADLAVDPPRSSRLIYRDPPDPSTCRARKMGESPEKHSRMGRGPFDNLLKINACAQLTWRTLHVHTYYLCRDLGGWHGRRWCIICAVETRNPTEAFGRATRLFCRKTSPR